METTTAGAPFAVLEECGTLCADRAGGPLAPSSNSVSERRRFPRAQFEVGAVRGDAVAVEPIEVICEHELVLTANGERLATLMCSQASLAELACGFLFSEGVADSLADIVSLAISDDGARAFATLRRCVEAPLVPVITSGFGGTALVAPSTASSFGSADAGAPSLPSIAPASGGRPFDAAAVRAAVTAMRVGAREYAATRGTHCAALFDGDGAMVALFEDIGRHNTFDKLAGHCLLAGLNARGMLLATTGRVSSEMMRKAARLGVGAVASLSGPTDAAVRAARTAGIMLAGYVSSSQLTLYAGSLSPTSGFLDGRLANRNH